VRTEWANEDASLEGKTRRAITPVFDYSGKGEGGIRNATIIWGRDRADGYPRPRPSFRTPNRTPSSPAVKKASFGVYW